MDFGGQLGEATPAPTIPNVGAWQGLTIKEILEKVDLSSIVIDEDGRNKEDKIEGRTQEINPESAFLGPKLWSRSIPVPSNVTEGGDFNDFSVMNIDDFLTENGFDLNDPASPSDKSSSGNDESDTAMETAPVAAIPEPQEEKRGAKRPAPKKQEDRKGSLPKEATTDFLYAESKRARMEREKEERKNKPLRLEFTPQDLALATVPGMDFDPRERAFAPDELRPQPIIRKRKKSYVPSESKDDKYWEKRVKNNVAARRSREARRLKENQIALRTAFLEKENAALRSQLEEVKAENIELSAEKQILLEKLKHCESKTSLPPC